METRCPKCGVVVRLNLNSKYVCFIHGEFEMNYITGNLEPLKKEDADEKIFQEKKKKGFSRVTV